MKKKKFIKKLLLFYLSTISYMNVESNFIDLSETKVRTFLCMCFNWVCFLCKRLFWKLNLQNQLSDFCFKRDFWKSRVLYFLFISYVLETFNARMFTTILYQQFTCEKLLAHKFYLNCLIRINLKISHETLFLN